MIVWIAPWCGIFLTDWLLRAGRYDPVGLQDDDAVEPLLVVRAASRGRRSSAQVLGGIAALAASSASFLPSWANPITVHTSGADFSIFLGLGVGALAYLVLGARRRCAARRAQRPRALSRGVSPASKVPSASGRNSGIEPEGVARARRPRRAPRPRAPLGDDRADGDRHRTDAAEQPQRRRRRRAASTRRRR